MRRLKLRRARVYTQCEIASVTCFTRGGRFAQHCRFARPASRGSRERPIGRLSVWRQLPL